MTETQQHPATLHLGGDAWAHPDLAALLTPTDKLRPHPRNPRNGDTDAIVQSIRTNGLYRPIYAQRTTGHILAGNHTYAAALELGAEQLPVVWLDVDEDQAARILIADNRTADLGWYDNGLLTELLADIHETDMGLLGTGYAEDDLERLIANADNDVSVPDDGRAPTTGELLAIADVTWGEPKHVTHHGDVWTLGRHTLVVARVTDEHDQWAPFLTPEHKFCPYPEPYLTTSTLAEESPLLLVQPNVYLAGHLLDKHASTHPDEKVHRHHE